MNIALIITIAAAIIFLICDRIEDRFAAAVGDLARLAFFAGLLAWLLGK